MAKILNKKTILPLLLAAVIIAGGGYYVAASRKTSLYPKAPDTAQQAQTKHTTSNTPSNTTASSSSIPKSTTPQSSPSGAIIITSPLQGDTVTSGTHVSGSANVGNVYYRLKTVQNGQIAGTGPIAVQQGKFGFDLLFQKAVQGGTDQGTLEVYSLSATGAEADIADVNVEVQG